jgi:Spy/CpxP family protein refolding chaperone
MKGITMKTKLRFAAVLTALSVFAAVNGFGKEHQRMERMEIRRGCCELPNLTDAQKKQMEEINQNLDKAMIPLKAQVELKQAELKTLLVVEKPDKSAIDKKIEEIGAIRVQIQKKRIGARLDTRALLAPEQRTAFDKQTLMPFGGGMMMDDENGPRMEKMIRMRIDGPPGCPSAPGCMPDNEENEIEHKTE